jgi:WD40 repeat protein
MVRAYVLRISRAFLWTVLFAILFRVHVNSTQALPLQNQYCKFTELHEKQSVKDITWSPSMKYLASTSNQAIDIWDVKAGKVSKTLTNEQILEIDSLAWSPDGYLIAVLGNGITVLDAESSKAIDVFKDGQNAANGGNVDWDSKGDKLAFIRVGEDGHRVEIWDRKSGDITKIGLPLANYGSVKWSPKENKIAISDGDQLQIWDVASDRIVTDFHSVRQTWSIAWNSDGHLLAGGNASYATNDSTIQIWDASTSVPSKQLINVLEGHTGGVITVAWKPETAILAVLWTSPG